MPTRFEFILWLYDLPGFGGRNDGIRPVRELELFAGDFAQFFILVVFEDISRMVITDVCNEVVPMLVVQLGRDGDETLVNIGNPSEKRKLSF